MTVFFLHARDFANAGDRASCPFDYFDFLRRGDFRFLDLTGNQDRHGRSRMLWSDPEVNVTGDDVLIVGGGLVGYCDGWHEAINSLAGKAGKVVGWGFGRNYQGELVTKVRLDYGRFSLIGTRDFRDNDLRYLPCASCMHQEFRKGRQAQKYGVGVVLHREQTLFPCRLPADAGGAAVVCNAMDVTRLIRFIASCGRLMSNSYHACYWAALLNVPCTTVSETANHKFLDAEFDWHGGDNSGFYERCVRRNEEFAEEVRRLIIP